MVCRAETCLSPDFPRESYRNSPWNPFIKPGRSFSATEWIGHHTFLDNVLPKLQRQLRLRNTTCKDLALAPRPAERCWAHKSSVALPFHNGQVSPLPSATTTTDGHFRLGSPLRHRSAPFKFHTAKCEVRREQTQHQNHRYHDFSILRCSFCLSIQKSTLPSRTTATNPRIKPRNLKHRPHIPVCQH